MKGIGTDEALLISVVCCRDRLHMQKVRASFNRQFKRDLIKDILSETSGNFEDMVVGPCYTAEEYRAKVVMKACKFAGTNDKALIDAICTANTTELKAANAAFSKLFKGKSMEKVIKTDISGNYEKFMLAVIGANAPDHGVNEKSINSDLEALRKATEGKVGTDEKTVIDIISRNSQQHLARLDVGFVKISRGGKSTLCDCLIRETSGNFERALVARITPEHEYFTNRLVGACKGLGTNEKDLSRVLLLMNPYQLQDCTQRLAKDNHLDLEAVVKRETSGNYRKALVAYITTNLKP